MEPSLMENDILILWRIKVPEVGVEPTHPKVHEFESCASANSATPARDSVVYSGYVAMSMGKGRLAQLR